MKQQTKRNMRLGSAIVLFTVMYWEHRQRKKKEAYQEELRSIIREENDGNDER